MFSSKSKGLFIEINEYSILAAVTSGLVPPLTVESLNECPRDSAPEKIAAFVPGIIETKAHGFAVGSCGVYPPNRFFRRATIEQPAKAKDPNYLNNLLTEQYRIEIGKNAISVLNAQDGGPFDISQASSHYKEMLICGAPHEELLRTQNELVSCKVYPERLELGTLASLGGLMHYARVNDLRYPTLMVEILPESSNLFIFSQEAVDISRPIPYGLNIMFPVIQQELGLKDEESAKKLFNSNTFDFTEMGPTLLRKMVKELQSSTGFYEVQTGQTIGQIFLTLLPRNLNWIHTALSRALGVEVMRLNYKNWLQSLNIKPDEAVQVEGLDGRWMSLFSLMGDYQPSEDGE